MAPTLPAKLTAEFIGTFTLVFTACNNNMAGGQLGSFSVACSLMVGVYALGTVSGANFNPAVTLSLLLAKLGGHKEGLEVKDACLYWITQLIAGLCAGMASAATWGTAALGPSSTIAIPVWIPTTVTVTPAPELITEELQRRAMALAGELVTPAVGLGPVEGLTSVFLPEALFTCLLCFVVLSVATCNDHKDKGNAPSSYFGLAIGLTVAAGAVSIGPISGCSMNPAVSFGVSMSSVAFADQAFTTQLGNFAFYSLSELVGAAVGFGFFAACRFDGRLRLADRAKDPPLASKLVAEFFGTFYLVLTVVLVVAQGDTAPLAGVIGIASVLMACIYSTAAVSGANLNPAVSFGLLIIGELPVKDFALYILVQILGGFSAVLMVYTQFSGGGHLGPYAVTLEQHVPALGANQIHLANGAWAAIGVAEFFYTFLLVFVVLNVAVRDAGHPSDHDGNQYYGLAIGFVVIVGGVCVGGLSGGCFNPAIALSVDFGSLFSDAEGNQYGWGFCYVLFELAGAAAAAGLFNVVSMKDEATYKEPGSSDSDSAEGSS